MDTEWVDSYLNNKLDWTQNTDRLQEGPEQAPALLKHRSPGVRGPLGTTCYGICHFVWCGLLGQQHHRKWKADIGQDYKVQLSPQPPRHTGLCMSLYCLTDWSTLTVWRTFRSQVFPSCHCPALQPTLSVLQPCTITLQVHFFTVALFYSVRFVPLLFFFPIVQNKLCNFFLIFNAQVVFLNNYFCIWLSSHSN